MKSLKMIFVRSAVVVGALALSAPAFAHGDKHEHPAKAGAPAGMQTQRMMPGDLSQHDARALWLLHFANQAETTTAPLADSRSQNDQVKSYAKMLLADHSSLDTKVMDFARDHKVQFPEMMQGMGGAGMQGTTGTQGASGTDQGASGTDQGVSGQQGTGGAGTQGNSTGAGGMEPTTEQGNPGMTQNPQAAPPNMKGMEASTQGMPLSHSQMEMMSHAKQSAKKLESLRGHSFDRQFLTNNVKDHRQVISELNKMMAQVQNADLKNMIKDTLPKLQEHEKKAQDLLHSLGGQARTPPPAR